MHVIIMIYYDLFIIFCIIIIISIIDRSYIYSNCYIIVIVVVKSAIFSVS